MSNYSDEDDFEACSEEEDEIADLAPMEVNVLENRKPLHRQSSRAKHDGSSVGDDDDSVIDELELHGRGNRMKLSTKPPETLLRQYQHQISRCLEEGKNDQAVEDLVRCTALARIVYGDRHWKYAESEANLAKAYWRHKSLAPQAQQHAEEARNIMLKVVQAGGAQEERTHIYRTLLSVYVTLGEAYNAQQKFTDAELCYQKAEKILSEQSKTQKTSLTGDEQELDQELKSDLRIAQGKLAANQGKAASSIAYFEEAINLLQEEYGDDSIKLIPLYQMVGKVEQSREGANHIKSIEAYLQAHSIANANYSEGTEELAETGHQLALAYTRAAVEDKDAETSAESYLNECIATYQSLHGPNHEKTLRCQDEVARLMIRTDRSDEAIQLLRSTIAAKKETFGEYSQSLASTYKLLGSVHMSQGNMEKSLKSMNKELSDAEQQYRNLQQQHLSQLQAALDEKDKQLADGKALFDQLKKDFKYNLKLLQERDDELEQNDTTVAQLRGQLGQQLDHASQVGVRLHETSEKCAKLEQLLKEKEKSFQEQLQSEQAMFDRKLHGKVNEHSNQRLEWDAQRRALEENYKIAEERRLAEKRDARLFFEEQLAQREKDWKARIEELEMQTLAHELRVTSLTTETEKLREDRYQKGQIAESAEEVQRHLENELKQSKWELQDYREMCTRRIQDLESQIVYSEQSQRALVEKYERKVIQTEARLQEMTERHEKIAIGHKDQVNDLNKAVRELKETISNKETELARSQWKVEDLTIETTKLIESHALEKLRFNEQLEALENSGNVSALKEEIVHLKGCVTELREDLKSKTHSIEEYQTKLVTAADELSEAERQRAKLELDCQSKCAQIKREQSDKSENLISRLSQAKNRSDATIKRLEKEAGLHQQAIDALKKERDNAYSTLASHGIALKFADLQPTRNDSSIEINQLKLQNENLKKVIAQMRYNVENNTSSASPSKPNTSDIYVKSLEDEVTHLKQQLRQQERSAMKAVPPTHDMVDAIISTGDAAVKEVVASLNANIAALRTEKVELMAASRKQQVELEFLKSELQRIKQNPRDLQVEIDQSKYELNSVTRRLESVTSSYKQRIGELERQLESIREEAAEYHRNLLSANADNHTLSTELSNLKMMKARSGNVINYGAQELVIQNLQDENTRLRQMVHDKLERDGRDDGGGNELQKALSRVAQLNKEKIILTELSNRLRSELLRAGIDTRKPNDPPRKQSSYHHSISAVKESPSDVKMTKAVSSKLDQLEKLQYELTKAKISSTSQNSDVKNVQAQRQNSPPTRQQKSAIPAKGHIADRRLPNYVEQPSSSGSSIKAKGKSAVLQPSNSQSNPRFQAPQPKTKLKSNIPWVKDGKPVKTAVPQSKENYVPPQPVDEDCTLDGSLPQISMRRDTAFPLDSMDFGSSINEIWKLVDEPLSPNSTYPS